jgi:malonate decarboxylase alpha subunit
LLEAIIEPGDPVVIAGDNQKRADFPVAALAKADPAGLQIFQVANSNSRSSQLQLYAKENFHE